MISSNKLFLLSFIAVNAFPRFPLYVSIAVVFLSTGLIGTVTGVVLIQLVFTLGLVTFGFLDSVRQNPRLLWSILGAAAALVVWNAVLTLSALRTGRTLKLEIVLRKQHYLQACAQASVLLYWGWYWREVYDSAHLIAAQLVFAYAFDMLLGWSRRFGRRL